MKIIRLTLLSFFLFFYSKINTQQFIQIETKNDAETIKFPIGSTIKILTIDNPKEYKNIVITGFDYSNDAIQYEDGEINLSDIVVVQTVRPAVGIFGKFFMSFGVVWLGYGLVTGELKKNDVSGYTDLTIGLTAVGLGYGIQKGFYIRKYKMGKRYKLRLIDLRMG
jgi:hypothetical protein